MSATVTYLWGPEAFEGQGEELAEIARAIYTAKKSSGDFIFKGQRFYIADGCLQLVVHSSLTPLPEVLGKIAPTRISLYEHLVARPYYPPAGDTWFYGIDKNRQVGAAPDPVARAELEACLMASGSVEYRLRIEGREKDAVWKLYHDILRNEAPPTEKWGLSGSGYEEKMKRLSQLEEYLKKLADSLAVGTVSFWGPETLNSPYHYNLNTQS